MERELSCTGVTMHKVAQRLDGGDVLAQHTIDITADTDSIDVYLQSAAWARATVEQLLEHFDDRWAAGRPQAEKHPYWKLSRVRAADAASRNESGGGPGDLPKIQFHDSGGAGRRVVLCDRDRDRHGPLPCEVQRLSPTRALYRVMDGHLRLHIHPMEVRT